jgi:hypothetical protein
MPDQNSKYIMNESELPDDLEFVERQPVTAGSGAAPTQDRDRYQGAILSAPLGLDTDIAKSQLPGANPAYRLMPASIAGNPATNASIQSTARKVVAATPPPPASSGSGGSVSLDVPSIFTPVAQTITLPGTLTIGLATQLANLVFLTPSTLSGGLEAQNTGSGSGVGSVTTTASPTTGTSWGLFSYITNGSPGTPSGWTQLFASSPVFVQSLSGTSPVSVSVSPGAAGNNLASALFIFNGTLPTLVQAAHATTVYSGTVSFASNNTAGNTLVIVMTINRSGTAAPPLTMTLLDSAANNYQQILNQTVPGANSPTFFPDVQQSIWVVTNCAGGPNTISYLYSGAASGGDIGNVTIYEFSPFTTLGGGIPFFGQLNGSYIAGIDASKVTTGILSLLVGGTGANLSTTGGVSKFLSQASAGAPITVVRPDYSDLAGINIATKYKNISLVSNGLASEVALVDLTTQAAAITATTLYAVPGAGAGMYRISWVATVTQAAATPPTSVLGGTNGFQILYTDKDTSVVKTMPGTVVAGVDTNSTNSTSTGTLSGCFIVNAAASTNIQYQMDYSSSGATPMQFNLHIKLEAL